MTRGMAHGVLFGSLFDLLGLGVPGRAVGRSAAG
jgi:hypothetical protein